jgi:hypothetical protein
MISVTLMFQYKGVPFEVQIDGADFYNLDDKKLNVLLLRIQGFIDYLAGAKKKVGHGDA